jgi:flagellar hook protein FlgE
MLRSLGSGVSGLKSFQTKLDIIGNNIANVNTVGYKKSQVVFEDLFSQTVKEASAPSANQQSGGTNPIQVGLGTQVKSIKSVFTPGTPTATYNQTDLYIDGDGFFVVKEGAKEFLTRDGSFTLDKNNTLVNQNGLSVLDTNNNPITLTGYVTFKVGNDGTITGVKSDGTAEVTGKRIQIALITNPSGLQKEGNSLYAVTENTTRNQTTNVNIISGQLEMSNVDLTEEMTDMITAQRGFQATAKIITVSDTILEELVNLKR